MSSRVALPRLVSGPGRTLYWMVVLLILAVLILASPSASWAQAVTGTLLGTVTDAQGRTTRVRLTALSAASGLGSELFVLKDPRPKNVGRARM